MKKAIILMTALLLVVVLGATVAQAATPVATSTLTQKSGTSGKAIWSPGNPIIKNSKFIVSPNAQKADVLEMHVKYKLGRTFFCKRGGLQVTFQLQKMSEYWRPEGKPMEKTFYVAASDTTGVYHTRKLHVSAGQPTFGPTPVPPNSKIMYVLQSPIVKATGGCKLEHFTISLYKLGEGPARFEPETDAEDGFVFPTNIQELDDFVENGGLASPTFAVLALAAVAIIGGLAYMYTQRKPEIARKKVEIKTKRKK